MTKNMRVVSICLVFVLNTMALTLAQETSIKDRVSTNEPVPIVVRTNSLGMEFVPIPGTSVWFSRWETRVKDYAVFEEENKVTWPKPAFEQGPTHPAVNVSWSNAQAFCQWLTQRERKKGGLKAEEKYRLPTDAEWSQAVGLGAEEGEGPSDKESGNQGVYPWGKQWPPPTGAGNYLGGEVNTNIHPVDYHSDGYKCTAPVGSFKVNAYGLYDMGGNAIEWCEDRYVKFSDERILRGGCWATLERDQMRSAYRDYAAPDVLPEDLLAKDILGFRCVLDTGKMMPAPVEVERKKSDDEEGEDAVEKFGLSERQKKEREEALLKSLKDNKDEWLIELKNFDPEVRSLGIWTIQTLKLKEMIPQLCIMATNDPSEKVRTAAVVALGNMGGQEVAPIMIKALESKNPAIRASAADKLVGLHRKEGVGALVQLLDEPDRLKQNHAFSALKAATGRDFGDYATLRANDDPGLPRVIENPEKKKEVFEKWKKWWKEEGNTFVFPKE